ncbi:hypothetical protein EB235_19255 [Mesorhizobium loti R88b]|uniref:Uncharacterized protein n=2 Tax=Rhizobium loti TaxID=381 RepID=A0A6M7WWM8_RHILI|nr:hypothetical protein EB235_19255 [Mesorhizobium loti R88b]
MTSLGFAKDFVPSISYCEAKSFADQCEGLVPDSAECKTKIEIATKGCDEYLGSTTIIVWKKFNENIAEIVATLFLALSLLLASLNQFMRNQIARFKARLADPYIQRAPKYETFGLSAMVVGIGGCGKTSIVKALSASEHADPDVATAEALTYSLVNEVTVRKQNQTFRRLVRMYISDHVGQNFRSIFSTDFFKDSEIALLKKCVIVVVDLFPPVGHLDGVPRRKEFNLERIAENLEIYSDEMVQLITQNTKSGDSVVLFINKIDQLQEIDDTAIKRAKGHYRPLVNRLAGIKGLKLSVLVGSAGTGMGICGTEAGGSEGGLLGILVEASGPI